ncbi:hypothetical protein [Borrelia persica]|uniref:hypothetical protein n=1 Tax=Borrelia persica TaxID=44448 RepID=UPI000466CAEB|nr:hypothetical protein [Borrelia persica]
MQRIYVLVFAFSFFVICCRQGENDNRLVENSKNKWGNKFKFSLPPVSPVPPFAPDIQMEKVDEEKPTDVLDKQEDDEVCDVDFEKVETIGSLRTKAYIALRKSLSMLIALYYYRPEGFSDFLFKNIKAEFGVDEIQEFRDSVYAVVKGDIGTLKNLEKIVMYSFGRNRTVEQDYNDEDNAYLLLSQLNRMVNYLIGVVMHKNGYILSSDNLLRLQDCKDVEGLNELVSILDNIYLKWESMVKRVQYVINSAAELTTKDKIMERLKPITSLEVVKYNQPCYVVNDDVRICELKNSLRTLCRQLEQKVNALMKKIPLRRLPIMPN